MLKVLQIVKRLGPVGGLERYVWELSHALASKNVEVNILCEQVCQQPFHQNIQVHCLGSNLQKPRWVSMLIFSHRVSAWVKNRATPDLVIHSHERTAVHHITTFHGSVFAYVRNKPWWKLLSPRIAVWLYLEKRELCASNVRRVLPNSDLIRQQLKHMYPCIGERLDLPAYPGDHLNSAPHPKRPAADAKEIIIFVGQEWKRKGLPKAVQIAAAIRSIKPQLELWVLGPEPNDIKHLFKDWHDGFRLFGWQEASPYLPQASLLLHPAAIEPYGMAIAEAASVGVPVVISDHCGIANLVTGESGSVVKLDAPLDQWKAACLEQLERETPVKKIAASWDEVADQHVKIYQSVI